MTSVLQIALACIIPNVPQNNLMGQVFHWHFIDETGPQRG